MNISAAKLFYCARSWRRFLLLFVAFGVLSSSACHLCQKKHIWNPPIPADSSARSCKFTKVSELLFSENDNFPAADHSTSLSDDMEQSYQAARKSKSSAQAVDAYYASLVRSWIFISRYRNLSALDEKTERAWDIYHSSLTEVIINGQRSGRLDLQKGLLVKTPVGREWIPIRLNNFVWPSGSKRCAGG